MKKNWRLFLWAIKHLDIDENGCGKGLKNRFLLRLMDLSGVTYMDAFNMYHEIGEELKRRDSA